ncbi:hypothetical protein ZWY2020_014978 [Hordeum vulgare]|nr:hypothetical protein ZWY2020_014978 [Hordeum vulgare]
MLEEYEKLAAAVPDGSAKLRIFLFPASDQPASAPARTSARQRRTALHRRHQLRLRPPSRPSAEEASPRRLRRAQLRGLRARPREGEIEYVEGDDIEMGNMDDMEDFEGFGDEDGLEIPFDLFN